MVVGTLLLLTLSACGGADGSGASAAADSKPAGGTDGAAAAGAVAGGPGVEVIAKDIAFEPTALTVGPGPTKITLRNEGAIVHNLVIEGVPTFKKLEVDTNGASDTGILDAAPGTYTAYCDQPGHRAAGMETELTVS